MGRVSRPQPEFSCSPINGISARQPPATGMNVPVRGQKTRTGKRIWDRPCIPFGSALGMSRIWARPRSLSAHCRAQSRQSSAARTGGANGTSVWMPGSSPGMSRGASPPAHDDMFRKRVERSSRSPQGTAAGLMLRAGAWLRVEACRGSGPPATDPNFHATPSTASGHSNRLKGA